MMRPFDHVVQGVEMSIDHVSLRMVKENIA